MANRYRVVDPNKPDLRQTQSSTQDDPILNKANQVRRDTDNVKNISIGLYDIDLAFKDFLERDVKPMVEENGQLVQSKPFALPDIVNRKLNYIAKSSWAQDGYFEGEIAEVRVWNIVRTPEEIKQNINSRLSGNEPGLVGYYPLNGDANDKTSKANHGTINGAIWQQGEVPITG